ncbi:hypothetical protein CYMTET_23167 [Cymbomonas tetramitiformis]|uniref:RING-type domain-containing protein n=1 Tax=Cymbomonas tetramitiformis TaxID=36881 RepID=A0AAE0L1J9_9CHLO|nr:hypothetical protein CYMTET_23167 [Cymbomonas tetramitiformis]
MLSAAEELPPPRLTRSIQELQQAMMCAVCQETMVDAHILPCGHSYCGACIWTWSETRLTCPECRSSFRTPIENTLLEDFHELTLAQSLTSEEAVERKKRKAECVQERTRMKRNRVQMEALTRRNGIRQPGAAGLPPGLIEVVLRGAYAISVTGGSSGRPQRPADVLRRVGAIRVVSNPYHQDQVAPHPPQPPQPQQPPHPPQPSHPQQPPHRSDTPVMPTIERTYAVDLSDAGNYLEFSSSESEYSSDSESDSGTEEVEEVEELGLDPPAPQPPSREE